MLSRVAESIFWINRYMERAENYSRFIEVNYATALDMTEDVPKQWGPLVDTTGDMKLYAKEYGEITQKEVIHFLTFDKKNPNSIVSCVNYARENARRVRENISLEMWESINRFYLWLNEHENIYTVGENSFPDFLADIRRQVAGFYGFEDSTISHDEVWNFAMLGRLLERADKTTRILDIKYFILLPSLEELGGSLDMLQWVALLKSASAHEMYNRMYKSITPYGIAEFLILNRTFPRAIHYAVLGIMQTLRMISGVPSGSYSNDAEKLTGKYLGELSYQSIDEIIQFGLHEYLDNQQIKLNEIGAAVEERYFRM